MQSVLTQWDRIHALAKKAFLAVAPSVLVSVDIIYILINRYIHTITLIFICRTTVWYLP